MKENITTQTKINQTIKQYTDTNSKLALKKLKNERDSWQNKAKEIHDKQKQFLKNLKAMVDKNENILVDKTDSRNAEEEIQ